MGQYHSIYNLTKKEVFNGWGAKLWEKASSVPEAMGLMVLLSNSNGRGGGDLYIHPSKYSEIKPFKPVYTYFERYQQESIDKISGRWAGDEIVIQGDYAKKGDPAFISSIKGFTDITPLVEEALKFDFPDFFKKQLEFRSFMKSEPIKKRKSRKLKAVV